jgi:hypothetical protein
VLRIRRDELGEGGEETVDPGAGHGAELPGQERWEGQQGQLITGRGGWCIGVGHGGRCALTFPAPGADGGCEDDLESVMFARYAHHPAACWVLGWPVSLLL